MSASPQTQSLVPFKYDLFPPGDIKPNGWMRNQIHLCAQGLGGNLRHFYRFVKESTWLGGTWEYSPLNEAAPYWYNYIVPLAYTIDDSLDPELALEIRKQADGFLEYLLAHQADDGWLGPEKTKETRGFWARCLLLQGMMNHAIADSSKSELIMTAIFRFVRLAYEMLSCDYEGGLPKPGDQFDLQLFGVVRAHELSTTLQWLYEKTEDADDKRKIWEVMEMMWEVSRIGERDWTVFFKEENFPKLPSVRGEKLNFKHGVNVAEGLRYPSQLYRMHPSEELAQLSHDAVSRAFKYHGTAAGSLTSDEYLGGLSPVRASEICCSVELVFSLNYLYQLWGDNEFADRAEMAAYNAIPAGISPDWWSHQYITQVNQPWACELTLKENEKIPFYDTCRYANVFGLEPQFPCCTVNHSTALPKFLMNTFLQMHQPENSKSIPAILHAYLLPARLKAKGITINCDSNYPFAPCALAYSIETDTPFDFLIRIPSWSTTASIIQVSQASSGISSETNSFISNILDNEDLKSFYRVHFSPGKYKVQVTLQSEIHIKKHENGTISIYYGPLLYALAPDFKKTTRLPRNYTEQPSDCFEITQAIGQDEDWASHIRDHDYLPTSAWNIAIDPSKEMKVLANSPWDSDGTASKLPEPIWALHKSPVVIEVTAIQIEWPVRNGTAADPGDIDTETVPKLGIPFGVQLVPYGTAKLHMAQFPVVKT